ncbi:Hypothetical_protein [Hexamita inflata]|uniref:Hypothetical_protein n=1 Tax=Hexamita inflata TaxID=28002 RepID=A0AA86R3J8_9EUKA|nr:Hypothetical protein HINF_LOCUS49160 [Hexamita inflata]CAI9961520.1 Hypothetical protein HINF_LOCUS49165 [Hexamita inflata]
MQFGGIICYQMNTTTNISDVTLNIVEQWKTNNVNNSGYILGQAVQSQNSIKTLCFMEHLTSNSYFIYFGLVGLHNGTLSICNIQLQFMIIQGNFAYFGTLGYINGSQCIIYNVQLSLQVPINNSGLQIGVLGAVMLAENWSVTNITINNSHIYSQQMTGLVISYINSGIFSQINIYSSTANSSGSYRWAISGGLYGDSRIKKDQNTSYNTTINQCYFQNNSIFTNNTDHQATSGGLIGDSQDNQISIQNVLLIFYNVSSYGSAVYTESSGLIAFLYNSIININNVQISYINLLTNNLNIAFASGFIAQSNNCATNINNSKLSNTQISISGTPVVVGIIFSLAPQVLIATNFSTEGTNSINGASVNNCGNIQSFDEQNGC